MVQVSELSDRDFRESVIGSGTTTIVLFHNPNETRSLSMKVIIDELANEFQGTSFARVNTQQNADTPSRYGLLAFPAVVVFEGGEAAMAIFDPLRRKELRSLMSRWLREA